MKDVNLAEKKLGVATKEDLKATPTIDAAAERLNSCGNL